ncbi:hypothetical protein [Ruicaihuangia caeni]|uniref:Lipoprotein n=1 Tax=Ruicaihuangia caeni TaxID=3042517 RepID=A0AAW6T370_9MICO|nr:hypothetical protein [Klugiella sp. YN-L-19]MDI2097889.1 hypothetical protein [Klugiella sp. YN-L-19]
MRVALSLMLVVLLSGCARGAVHDEGGHSGPRPPSEKPAAEPCVVVSQTTLAALNTSIAKRDARNSLQTALARHDAATGSWFIVGAYTGPAGAGEGALGIWSTDSDATSDDFDGMLWSVDGGAAQHSDSPQGRHHLDERGHAILGCAPLLP